MGSPNSHDENDIEAELLNELEELDRNYHSSASPSISSSSSFPYDTADEALLGVDSSINGCFIDSNVENNYHSNNAFDPRYAGDTSTANSNLLSTIPGYEIFKGSSELTSASCQATLQTVESIKYIVGEDTIRCECTEKLCSTSCNKTGDFPINPKGLSESCNKDDNEQGQSSKIATRKSVVCNDITNTIDATAVKPSFPPIFQPPLQHNHNLTFLTILEDEVKPLITQEMQEEIEIEAQQECIRQNNKRSIIVRKRAMEASKERLKCANQNSSAQCVQRTFREYRRRKISSQMRATCRGFQYICNTRERLTLKYSFRSWIENTTKKRAGIIILLYLHAYSKRRKKRRSKLSEALSHLMSTMTKRRFFLFWTIYLSTMKLQETLMHQLKSSTITIQNTFRRYQAKCILKRYQEEYAATMIQKHFRGHWIRKSLRIIKENEIMMSRAAILIQKLYRGYSSRTHLNKVMLKNYSYADTDLDKILIGEEIDFLDEIFGTMEDVTDSFQWKPCKPKRKSVGQISTPMKFKEESTSTIEVRDRVFNTTISRTNKNSPIDIPFNGTCDLKTDQLLKYTKHQSKEGTNAYKDVRINQKEAELDQGKTAKQEDEDLMKEWNLSDQRVIKSMMKRKAKMNKNRKREELNKRLSNPENRFKRLMKNVRKRERRDRVVP